MKESFVVLLARIWREYITRVKGMVIRNSIKAIIINNTRLLVTKMKHKDGTYYTLPGGKQEADELMLEALKREVLEETGYRIEAKSLLFIREGFKDPHEEGVHRIEFMFVCDIIEEADPKFIEYDVNQIGTHWLNIDNIMHEPLFPVDLRGVIKNYFLGKKSPIYLGEME